MKVNLSMPDAIYEKMVVKWGIPNCYRKMTDFITLCQDIDKDDRTILISGDARRAIEKIFQTTVDNPEKLVRLIQNMSRVSLGGVDMEFTSDQLERMAAQAGFHGRTLEVYMRETVDELKSVMLERS